MAFKAGREKPKGTRNPTGSAGKRGNARPAQTDALSGEAAGVHTHHRGKVLFLSLPMRFLLMVVEQGTASRWWELLGRVGTHWLFLLAFCSLWDTGNSGVNPAALHRPGHHAPDAHGSPAGLHAHGDALCTPTLLGLSSQGF